MISSRRSKLRPTVPDRPPPSTKRVLKASTLVQDVVEVFIDDPLPALFEMNPADTSGLDVLYSGARVETTVGGLYL